MAVRPMRASVVGAGIIREIRFKNRIGRFDNPKVAAFFAAHMDSARRRAARKGLWLDAAPGQTWPVTCWRSSMP